MSFQTMLSFRLEHTYNCILVYFALDGFSCVCVTPTYELICCIQHK